MLAKPVFSHNATMRPRRTLLSQVPTRNRLEVSDGSGWTEFISFHWKSKKHRGVFPLIKVCVYVRMCRTAKHMTSLTFQIMRTIYYWELNYPCDKDGIVTYTYVRVCVCVHMVGIFDSIYSLLKRIVRRRRDASHWNLI